MNKISLIRIIKNIIHYLLSLINLKLEKKNTNYFPVEINSYEKKIISTCLKFSMTNNIRMSALVGSFKHIFYNKIPGDFVECGVWRGGNLILLQKLQEKYSLNRKIFAYDTFEGLSNPGIHDYDNQNVHANFYLKIEKKDRLIKNTHCFTPIEDVKKNYQLNTKKNKNLILIKGKVEETLKINKNLPKKISLLRLDTDFYSSTKIELEKLWSLLSKNGILIIDDYGFWKGSKKAVDDYFKNKRFLVHIDESCRLIFKI
jgi:hypothetical protein